MRNRARFPPPSPPLILVLRAAVRVVEGGVKGLRRGHTRSNENYALVHIRKGFLCIYSSHKAFLLFICFFFFFLLSPFFSSVSPFVCVLDDVATQGAPSASGKNGGRQP